MNISFMKILFFCSTIIILIFPINMISNFIYAYNAPEHHKHMGERAIEESYLDVYLKNNLGFSKGIDTKFTNPYEPKKHRTKTVREWIGYGGITEDSNVNCLYHFYDPISNQGLSDDIPFATMTNSLEWGRDHLANIHSWAKAREYYYLALTSPTKEERNKYWALTFRSLGQVCHLVQDLGSPAHVRNDAHLLSDPYEKWSISNSEYPEGLGLYTINTILLLGKLGNEDYRYPVVTGERFEDYWDTESGQGFAEFTNSNFVSGDTNVDVPEGNQHHYDNPQPTGLHIEPFTFIDSNGVQRTVDVTYYTSNVVDNYAPSKGVNPFNYLTAVSYWNFYTKKYNPNKIYYTLNSTCHQEYAKLLVPRTVGYGAGLLDYFFRGKLKLINVKLEGTNPEGKMQNNRMVLTLRNKGQEDLDGGVLSIYANYPSWFIQNNIKSVQQTINAGQDIDVDFTLYGVKDNAMLLSIYHWLVYHGGQLGSELFQGNQASVGLMFNTWDYLHDTILSATRDGVPSYTPGWGPFRIESSSLYNAETDKYEHYVSRIEYVFEGLNELFPQGTKVKFAKIFFEILHSDVSQVAIYRIVERFEGFPKPHAIYDPNPIAIIDLPINGGFFEVDVTEVLQGWIDGEFENKGLVMKILDESVEVGMQKWVVYPFIHSIFYAIEDENE